MTCEDIRELFSARVDDALTAEERARLDAHLASCAECAREWPRFERAVALLRAVEPERAPAGFVDRVLAARPRPWYAQLARGLLVPWPVKLPLEAAAIVLVAGLAIVIFQRSPELQQAAQAPAPPAAVTAPVSEPTPLSAPAPPSRSPGAPPAGSAGRTAAAPAPPAAEPPPSATTDSPTTSSERAAGPPPPVALGKKEKSALPDEAKQQALGETKPAPAAPAEARKQSAVARDARPPAESPAAVDERARSADAPRGLARRDAESDRERTAGPRQAAPVPEKSSRVQTLAAEVIHVEARLTVGERAGAERAVGDLVARAGGQVVSRTDDGTATVLGLAVAAERWDEFRRDLERVGSLRLDRAPPRAGRVRIVLRLEP